MKYKYFRIKDKYDDKEVYIVRTNLTKKQLEKRIKAMAEREVMTYGEILKKLGVEVIKIVDEVYI